jgi:hypothetical protein
VGRERSLEPHAYALREEHVAQRLRLARSDQRGPPGDDGERAGEPFGIARELHRRRIAEELALTCDAGLDQPAEEESDVADEREREPDQHDAAPSAVAAAGPAA